MYPAVHCILKHIVRKVLKLTDLVVAEYIEFMYSIMDVLLVI
jgi:hypothetical protein